MDCPSCHHALEEQEFAGNYGINVRLDLCFACKGIWFDKQESLQLSPGSILRLFQMIHEKGSQGHATLADLSCPRCGDRLAEVHDMQRSTRFQYLRCPQQHGRFTTFFQFLREKDFIRSLNPEEVQELKEKIKMINCSNCGAPVNLEKCIGCDYCKTPISMLDPNQIEKAIRGLKEADAIRPSYILKPSTPANASPSLPSNPRKIENVARRLSSRDMATNSELSDILAAGLVETGFRIVGELLLNRD